MSYTLIIPTHNRPSFLERTLRYLDSIRFNKKIIIADSSEKELEIKNYTLYETYKKKLDVDYFIKSGVDKYVEKMQYALNMVKTNNLMLSGDDDFIIPEQLNKASELLDLNHDFSIVTGKIATFTKVKQRNRNLIIWKNYPQYSFLDTDIDMRIKNFVKNYHPTFYALHRTKNFKENFLHAYNQNIERPLSEKLFCISDIINGKCFVLNELFMVREKGFTLTDENGNATWSNELAHKELITKENLNFSLYRDLTINKVEEVNNSKLSTERYQLIKKLLDEDFIKWAHKVNERIKPKNNNIIKRSIVKKFPIIKKIKTDLLNYYFLNGLLKDDKKIIKHLDGLLKNE